MLRKTSFAILASTLVFSQVERKAHALEPISTATAVSAAVTAIDIALKLLKGSDDFDYDFEFKLLRKELQDLEESVLKAINEVEETKALTCLDSAFDNLEIDAATLTAQEAYAREANKCRNRMKQLLKSNLSFSEDTINTIGFAHGAIWSLTIGLYERADLVPPSKVLSDLREVNTLVAEALKPKCDPWPTDNVGNPRPRSNIIQPLITIYISPAEITCTSFDGGEATSPTMTHADYEATSEFLLYQLRSEAGKDTAYRMALDVNARMALDVNEASEAQN